MKLSLQQCPKVSLDTCGGTAGKCPLKCLGARVCRDSIYAMSLYLYAVAEILISIFHVLIQPVVYCGVIQACLAWF